MKSIQKKISSEGLLVSTSNLSSWIEQGLKALSSINDSSFLDIKEIKKERVGNFEYFRIIARVDEEQLELPL